MLAILVDNMIGKTANQILATCKHWLFTWYFTSNYLFSQLHNISHASIHAIYYPCCLFVRVAGEAGAVSHANDQQTCRDWMPFLGT